VKYVEASRKKKIACVGFEDFICCAWERASRPEEGREGTQLTEIER
jgi:hypothetical protein